MFCSAVDMLRWLRGHAPVLHGRCGLVCALLGLWLSPTTSSTQSGHWGQLYRWADVPRCVGLGSTITKPWVEWLLPLPAAGQLPLLVLRVYGEQRDPPPLLALILHCTALSFSVPQFAVCSPRQVPCVPKGSSECPLPRSSPPGGPLGNEGEDVPTGPKGRVPWPACIGVVSKSFGLVLRRGVCVPRWPGLYLN